MNWGFHIKRLREERHLTQWELAKGSGLTRSHISQIERGVYASVKEETLKRLARGLDMTLESLTSEIYKAEPQARETPEQILNRFRVALPESVPIYEEFELHAGRPAEPVDYVPIIRDRAKGRRLEGYVIRGSSLIPKIEDGDIIIIDRDRGIDNGDIVACLVEGELHLAKLRKISDELYLENNKGRIKLEGDMIAAPVIEVRRRLK